MENPVSSPYHGGGTRSKNRRSKVSDASMGSPIAASLVNSEENEYLLCGTEDDHSESRSQRGQVTTDSEMTDSVNDDSSSLSEETEDESTEKNLRSKSFTEMKKSDQSSDPSSCDEMSPASPAIPKNKVNTQAPPTQLLGFDEYGNLTTLLQPPTHDKLESFDDEPINTKENIQIKQKVKSKLSRKKNNSTSNHLNEVVNGDESSRSSRSKAKIEESPEATAAQQEVQQAFKEFQAAPTSRYGRTRKRKADEDFYHGTINFNELRKITSTSSGSSSCSGSPKKIVPAKCSPPKGDNLSVSVIRDEPPMGCRLDKIWDDELSGMDREEESLGDFPSGTEEDYGKDSIEKKEVEIEVKQENIIIEDKNIHNELVEKIQKTADEKEINFKNTSDSEIEPDSVKVDTESSGGEREEETIVNSSVIEEETIANSSVIEKETIANSSVIEEETIANSSVIEDDTSQDKQNKDKKVDNKRKDKQVELIKIKENIVDIKEIKNRNGRTSKIQKNIENNVVDIDDLNEKSNLNTCPVKDRENDDVPGIKVEKEIYQVSEHITDSQILLENDSIHGNQSLSNSRNESSSDSERRSKRRKKSLKALRHSCNSPIDIKSVNLLDQLDYLAVDRLDPNPKSNMHSKNNKSFKNQNIEIISKSPSVKKIDDKSKRQKDHFERTSILSPPEKSFSKPEVYKSDSSTKSNESRLEPESPSGTFTKKAETSHMLDFVGAAQALRRRNIPIQELSSGESESSCGEASLDSTNETNEFRTSRSGRLTQRRRSSISRLLKSKRNSWAGPDTITDESQDEAVSANSSAILNDKSISKFGRPVKKPLLIDLVSEQKKQKEDQLKLREEIASHVVKHEGMLNKEELRILEKMHPCTYLVGDLVWVNMRGSPLWPAMLKYSQTEGTYTRISLKQNWSKIGGHREYHVQFFNDNNRTYWISPLNILPFEGYDKLLDYLNHLRNELRSMIKNKKHHAESLIKTLKHAKRVELGDKQERWMQAIRDAQVALPFDRYERIRRYTTGYDSDSCIQVEKPVNNILARTSAQKMHRRSAPPATTLKKKRGRPFKIPRPENKLISVAKSAGYSSQSTDGDFSGFESADDKKRNQKRFIDNNNEGDFEIYCKKRLSSYRKENAKISKKDAESGLYLEWSKLSRQQRGAYCSKSNVEIKRKYRSDSPTLDDHDLPGKAKKKKIEDEIEDEEDLKGTYKVVRNEKVCYICEGVSECPQNKGTDMLKCKGLCCGMFHLNCVGLQGAPTKDFKCQDCSQRRPVCFNCKSSEGTPQRCRVSNCGKFYHIECTESWPLVCRQKNQERMVCPRHFCHMCAAIADDMNDHSARTPPFTRCLRCPTTYHTGEDCIAAGVEEISSNHHICTKHLQVPKSGSHHINVSWCFCCSKGGDLVLCDQCPAAFHADCMKIEPHEGKGYVCEDCDNGKFPVYGDIVWVKLGAYRWWPGQVLHPRFIPDNIENLPHKQGMFCVHFFGSNDYYWVSRGRAFLYQEGDKGSKIASSKTLEKQFGKALKEAAEAFTELCTQKAKKETTRTQKGILKPSPYVKIETNRPVGNVRLNKIDLSSVNHCDCSPNSTSPCGDDSKCINRMLMFECLREVCPAGDKCCNQRFQKRQYPKIQSFKTSARGWGLQALQDIKKGEFVIEYVGELIDDEEFRKRLDHAHDMKEENFYFLTIDKDIMIDAGPKGNLARFMNHSCNPNCETQKWTVGGDTRVGLFSMQDIPAMTELVFNYNLECVGTEKKPCHCGGSQCSGFIGVKATKSENASKRPKVQKKHKKRKRKLAKSTDDECFRCGGTGDLILCDVAHCPKGYHLSCLGLEITPKGKWICPWHHCDDCGSKSVIRCNLCPNSFCRKHNRMEQHSSFGTICSDHNDDDDESEISTNQPSEDTGWDDDHQHDSSD